MESRITRVFSKGKMLHYLNQQIKFFTVRNCRDFQSRSYMRCLYPLPHGSNKPPTNRRSFPSNPCFCRTSYDPWVLKASYGTRTETIEKKLLKFMDMWKMEEAVQLMRESITEGNIPNQNIVLNLLQQLANLGETECLLDLHDFLRERNLVTDTKFFVCLQEAYYNSGRVDEGVAVLRILYHRTRKYRDVEPLFCLLAVMVIQNFPDRIDLIDGFVTDLSAFEVPVMDPMASLWKCYMLTEKFEKAEEMLLQNEEIQPFVPQMVNDICAKINKIDANYDKVLEQLLHAPFIKPKLKILVHETHAEVLCEDGKAEAALHSLNKARSQGISLHPERVRQIVTKIQHLSSDYQDDLQVLLQWCDQLDNT